MKLACLVVGRSVRAIVLTCILPAAMLPSASYAAATPPANTSITSSGLNTKVGAPITLPNGKVNFDITGGTRPNNGPNLFHSFGQFSIATNHIANFLNNTGLPTSNIIGRINGGQVSNIWGTIQTSGFGAANLYLINPSGFIFGPTATLNVGGSFAASTADYLRMSDGAKFYADPVQPSVLSVANVAAFGFINPQPVAISVEGSTLQVASGQTLSLIGGDVQITGTGLVSNFPTLGAPSGRIQIASVASPGEVVISNAPAVGADLDVSSFSKLGSIAVTQNATMLVEGTNVLTDPAGSVLIRGGDILLQGVSSSPGVKTLVVWGRGNPGGSLNIRGDQLQLDNALVNMGTQGAIDHLGTAVDINVSGTFSMIHGSQIASSGFGTGRAGGITVVADKVVLGDDNPAASPDASIGFYGNLASRTFGAGRSGDIQVTTPDLTVRNGFTVLTSTGNNGLNIGDAGNINIHADKLTILNRGSIGSIAFGGIGSHGGTVDVVSHDVLISAKNANDVANSSLGTGLYAQTGFGSKPGLLRLTADNIQLLDGGQLSTILFSTGPGANVEVTSKNFVVSGVINDPHVVSGPPDVHAGIDARVFGTSASGTGGDVKVTTDNLQITNGGFVGSSLFSGAPGKAGSVSVNADTININDRGTISASAVFGIGGAGLVNITAKDVEITGIAGTSNPFGPDFTGISVSTNAGPGGTLTLAADTLRVADNGSLSSLTTGSGNAGTVNLQIANNVSLATGGLVSASTSGAGFGGNVTMTTPTLSLNGGIIEATTSSTGNAGSITLDVNQLAVTNGGQISSSSTRTSPGSGNAGMI